MVDNTQVHGAKDEGNRPTVQSLRNRLRAEYEAGKGAETPSKRSWFSRKAKPEAVRSVPGAPDTPKDTQKRSWFSRKAKPETGKPDAAAGSAGSAKPKDTRKKKRWSLGRKTKPPETAATSVPDKQPPASLKQPSGLGQASAAPPAGKQPGNPEPPASRPPSTPVERRAKEWFRKQKAKTAEPKSKTGKKPTAPAVGRLAQRLKPESHEKLGNLAAIFMEGLNLPRPIIVASVVCSILGLALPLAVLQIYDRILPNQTVETLTLLVIGLFGAFVLDAILKVLRSYLLGWGAVRSGFDAQLTAVTRLLRAPHERVENDPPAIWVDGLEAVRELSAFEGGQSRLLTLDIPLAGISLVALGLVGGWLIIVPVVLIVAFGTLAAKRGEELKKVLTNRTDQDNRKHDFLVEVLTGIHTVKGLAMEPMILRRFERLQKSSATASYETILLGNKLQSQGNLFANMMMISVVSVGALMVMAGSLSIGGLACCSLLSGRLTQPVLRGIGMWTEFQNIQLAQERAGKFDGLSVPGTTDLSQARELTGAVELNDVGFVYPGAANKPALSGVELHIKPGEFVGIKGEDGSGRSTLVKLITGELKPTTGSVVIGGLESCPNREELQVKDVAYVSANSATFSGTILENITMFRTGPAIDAAQRAAKLIGLENDIHHLPDGYDTPLAQGVAQTLSSGFMQRVAIARALARGPKILIFDEANTMLDFRSDVQLHQGLEQLKGKMTAIIISNRPSFLAVADRHFKLTQGALEPLDLQQFAPKSGNEGVPMQGTAA